MAFSMAGGATSRAQINVTPLIDVLLTLIVMFMLVVSMDQEHGEKVQIPQPNPKQTPSVPQPRTVVIEIESTAQDRTPSVKINREDVAWQDLEKELTRIYLSRVEKVAFVRGDADVDFQYVADAIDKAPQAGVQSLGLMTNEQRLPEE